MHSALSGLEKNHASGILLNYDNGDYSQGYEVMKEASRALTKKWKPQTIYIDHNFRSSTTGVDDVGYNSFVFHIKYQKKLHSCPTN